MTTDEQIKLAEKNLEFLLDWVARHDNKSSILFGIGTAMLGVIGTLAPDFSLWHTYLIITSGVSVGLLFLCLFFLYLGNYPRLRGPSNSLFYFGSICKNCKNQYKEKFSKQTKEECLADILEQCHRNSEIITEKFKYLKGAFVSLLLSVIPWLITIYLFRVIPVNG
jgi:uncharacterized membrane protein